MTALVSGSFHLLPQSEGRDQAPETWARCTGTPCPPLYFQHLYFQVFSKASHRKIIQNPKWVKQEGVPKALRILAQEVQVGGCCMPGSNMAGNRVIEYAGCPTLRGSTLPCSRKAFHSIGLGLPGTGYPVNKQKAKKFPREENQVTPCRVYRFNIP